MMKKKFFLYRSKLSIYLSINSITKIIKRIPQFYDHGHNHRKRIILSLVHDLIPVKKETPLSRSLIMEGDIYGGLKYYLVPDSEAVGAEFAALVVLFCVALPF
ncbi:hypothetical protein J2780_003465 [Chryseobacterium camelliae]|nr:hypothetical protein [Chryseobacterium camelliae]